MSNVDAGGVPVALGSAVKPSVFMWNSLRTLFGGVMMRAVVEEAIYIPSYPLFYRSAEPQRHRRQHPEARSSSMQL